LNKSFISTRGAFRGYSGYLGCLRRQGSFVEQSQQQ
jgi:hypothetical protein